MNAWTIVATESSSRECRMRRSCRSWKKHLALTTLTCLSSDRSDESWTLRTRTSSDWATYMCSTKCQSTTSARDLRQVVLSDCPYQFSLIHVKSESAGGHPLLNSSNTLLDAGYCQLHIFWFAVHVQLIIIIALMGGGIKRCFCLTSVCLTSDVCRVHRA